MPCNWVGNLSEYLRPLIVPYSYLFEVPPLSYLKEGMFFLTLLLILEVLWWWFLATIISSLFKYLNNKKFVWSLLDFNKVTVSIFLVIVAIMLFFLLFSICWFY